MEGIVNVSQPLKTESQVTICSWRFL